MDTVTKPQTSKNSRRDLFFHAALPCFLIFIAGIGLGWYAHSDQQTTSAQPRNCLRLSGYKYIQPLLTCDTTAGETSPDFLKLQNDLEESIKNAKLYGDISTASIYLRDIESRRDLTINPTETFFPASLKKVPLMMQYFKESESNPGFLEKNVTITDPKDYNADSTIVPEEAAIPGGTYTNRKLIELMIQHSDNTAFQTLLANLGYEKFNQAYSDLQLNYTDNIVSIDDYMTPYQFSLFFRTLFNATYLNRENSEAALAMLSGIAYDKGLTASIPETIPVAHKFGVATVPQTSGDQGELHDCGIVYLPEHPYILCIMTKSQSTDITKVEKRIAEISETAYKYATNGFKKP